MLYLFPWQSMLTLNGINQLTYCLFAVEEIIINQLFGWNEINPWTSVIVEKKSKFFPPHLNSLGEPKGAELRKIVHAGLLNLGIEGFKN
ncbi:hypothetical protein SBDP1_870031 [Syntrophobacter sp. SbD1]|nr:hypothetical protein SBDP1_870031 [Syntrophobacter sp. SbD1]